MYDVKKKKSVNAMMALLLFGGFLSLLNETILNVALSNIMNVILPLLLGNGLGCSSFESALVLLPAAVVCCLMTLVSGKILIPLGLLIMLIALFALSRIQSTTIISLTLGLESKINVKKFKPLK
ncbi:hypothetical protein [Clostridium thailandense]|uniref:hypothetical protein n=1 Tax=Clostridium thailandense TaxID=2794346 RepID=UPI003989FCB9